MSKQASDHLKDLNRGIALAHRTVGHADGAVLAAIAVWERRSDRAWAAMNADERRRFYADCEQGVSR